MEDLEAQQIALKVATREKLKNVLEKDILPKRAYFPWWSFFLIPVLIYGHQELDIYITGIIIVTILELHFRIYSLSIKMDSLTELLRLEGKI